LDRAQAALRPVGQTLTATLPAARYQRQFVAELQRVRDLGDVGTIHGRLHISRSAAGFELSLARELFTAPARQTQRWSAEAACPSG
jgi:hypothetical protein